MLRSAALGFRHPLLSSPLGTFSFSGLAEHIALRIEGDEAEHGIRPRRLRGLDLGLGLDWRRRPADAEPSLTPSLSFGVRRQTGDGAADSLIDIAGSLAYRPPSKPLSFDFGASTLLGVAGNDSGAWDVRAAARYDPSAGPRGLELSLRSALGASSGETRAQYGLDGELSYGLFGGMFGSTVRPYVGVSGLAGAGGVRRAAGLRLRDEPTIASPSRRTSIPARTRPASRCECNASGPDPRPRPGRPGLPRSPEQSGVPGRSGSGLPSGVMRSGPTTPLEFGATRRPRGENRRVYSSRLAPNAPETSNRSPTVRLPAADIVRLNRPPTSSWFGP